MGMAMLVVQSWPDAAGPAWIADCMASVAAWAAAAGHGYRRLGDELFAPLPAWAREAATGARLAATDHARLLWIEALLAQAERVLWLDADVLVFDAAAMALPDVSHAVARERWAWREGALRIDERVSNAALLFARGDELLPWYLRACETILREAPRPLNRTALGPQLLTALDGKRRLPRIGCVATLSPLLMDEVLAGGGMGLDDLAAHWREPIGAVHLCRSLGGTGDAPDLVGEGVQAAVVARVLRGGLPGG